MSGPTYFVSGHIYLTEEEFDEHYRSRLDEAIGKKARFVVGDARGADSMAQLYLANRGLDVTVYHMSNKPRNNYGDFRTQGGFNCDEERDSCMTYNSTHDILWVRSEEEQKRNLGANYNPNRISGTKKNELRRQKIDT